MDLTSSLVVNTLFMKALEAPSVQQKEENDYARMKYAQLGQHTFVLSTLTSQESNLPYVMMQVYTNLIKSDNVTMSDLHTLPEENLVFEAWNHAGDDHYQYFGPNELTPLFEYWAKENNMVFTHGQSIDLSPARPIELIFE